MAKKLPDFESEEEEKKFWETHNPMDYVDWSKADSVVSRFFKDKKVRSDIFGGLMDKRKRKK